MSIISTDPPIMSYSPLCVYVVQVESFDGKIMAKPLAKSESKRHAYKFMEYVAAREMLGRDWNASEDGDVFYDPVFNCEEPDGEYLRWMTEEEVAELNPITEGNAGASCIGGISHVYNSSRVTKEGYRMMKRRYCTYKVEPTVYDLMESETDGEKKLRAINDTVELSLDQPENYSKYDIEPESYKYFPAEYLPNKGNNNNNTLRLTTKPNEITPDLSKTPDLHINTADDDE